jgi:hypothetical protein
MVLTPLDRGLREDSFRVIRIFAACVLQQLTVGTGADGGLCLLCLPGFG